MIHVSNDEMCGEWMSTEGAEEEAEEKEKKKQKERKVKSARKNPRLKELFHNCVMATVERRTKSVLPSAESRKNIQTTLVKSTGVPLLLCAAHNREKESEEAIERMFSRLLE